MKKFLLASLAVLCILACPVSGSAQGLSYDVTAAVDLPMGDLGDAVGTGVGVGTDIFIWSPESIPELQVGARFADNYFSQGDNSFFGTTVKTSLNSIEVVPTARYTLPSMGEWTFFGQVGLAMFFESVKVETSGWGGSRSASDSDTKVGLTIAAGAIIPAGGHQLVLMPLYSLVEDTHYLGLNVGLMIK